MCLRRPGPRCSRHATQRKDAASAAYAKAALSGDAAAARAAGERLLDALREYDTTPAGQESLLAQINDETDPEARTRLVERLEVGESTRQAQREAYRAAYGNTNEVPQEALITATPYRPESDSIMIESARESYFDSDEWAEWSDSIANYADQHGVIIESVPTRTDGLWENTTEPSGRYVVSGTPEDIEAFSADIAGRYNQDAVMVSYDNPQGRDATWTYDIGDDDPRAVLSVLAAAGVPGGSIHSGKLDVASLADAPLPTEARDFLAARYGTPTFRATTTRFVEKNPAPKAHSPIKELQYVRQMHAERHRLPPRAPQPILTVDDDMRAADLYESLPHQPSHPEVAESYRVFRDHLVEQHDALARAGYRLEPWPGGGQPYANSTEMLSDLRDRKHLYYFRTEVSDQTEGALPSDHPMAATVTVLDDRGQPQQMVVNDVFRGVHDALAHGDGKQFGPVGEKSAWWAHRESLPREAHLALWNETRGQNCWTNAGPHRRTQRDDGTVRLITKDEPGWQELAERPYAQQRCVHPGWEMV